MIAGICIYAQDMLKLHDDMQAHTLVDAWATLRVQRVQPCWQASHIKGEPGNVFRRRIPHLCSLLSLRHAGPLLFLIAAVASRTFASGRRSSRGWRLNRHLHLKATQ